MKISVIGTGYVGLVTGALLADRGNEVVCIDNNPQIVDTLNEGRIHIFEPGLEDIVKANRKRGTLSFSTELAPAVSGADITFLAVGTPSREDGSFNIQYLEQAAKDVSMALNKASGFKVMVVKSTVPQGTWKHISKVIETNLGGNPSLSWAYVSNPETLAEGTAVSDFSKPDRVMIGTYSDQAFALMKELYHPFNIKKGQIMQSTPAEAELAKLFSNTTLATRVAMVNEFARIADVTEGADMDFIRRLVCEDARIGYSFMFPSPGYGGSCFPKDIQGVVAQSRIDGYDPLLLSQVHASNEAHKDYLGQRIVNVLSGQSPKVAVWGLTFKPNTDDMRDAASIPIITGLLNRGAQVYAYDPKDGKAREIFKDRVTFVEDKYEAVQGADALVLLTEWKEFDSPDFARLKADMCGNSLFDLRNRWLPEAANRRGLDYYGVGRNYPLPR
ncbi:MAG: UDP-glucose/GDP-mannose dehydrogenase family protein [Candidatus Woesearchaeota archaeon]